MYLTTHHVEHVYQSVALTHVSLFNKVIRAHSLGDCDLILCLYIGMNMHITHVSLIKTMLVVRILETVSVNTFKYTNLRIHVIAVKILVCSELLYFMSVSVRAMIQKNRCK